MRDQGGVVVTSGRGAPSLLRRIVSSFGLGFGLFLLGALVQAFLQLRGISGLIAYLDNVVLGTLAGLVIFIYEQRRHRLAVEKLNVIAAMNHHVRNALQAISYAPYAQQPQQIKLIQESVERIQWALREVLPGGPAVTASTPFTWTRQR